MTRLSWAGASFVFLLVLSGALFFTNPPPDDFRIQVLKPLAQLVAAKIDQGGLGTTALAHPPHILLFKKIIEIDATSTGQAVADQMAENRRRPIAADAERELVGLIKSKNLVLFSLVEMCLHMAGHPEGGGRRWLGIAGGFWKLPHYACPLTP